MTDVTDRYDISKDVLFAPLEPMNVAAVAAAQAPWWNRTLGEVNDAVVRLAVMEGDFHWHQHDEEDEFFYVLEGALSIEVAGHAPFELQPGQGVTIPPRHAALPPRPRPHGGADGREGHGGPDRRLTPHRDWLSRAALAPKKRPQRGCFWARRQRGGPRPGDRRVGRKTAAAAAF
jgi:hypothetical protein